MTAPFLHQKRLPWTRLETGLLVGLVFLSIAVFWNSVNLDFVRWDDNINIYDNPHIQELSLQNIWWMFTDTEYARRYLPLAWLGWAIQYQISGLEPAGYHLGNVLFHALNSMLVFLITRRLLHIFQSVVPSWKEVSPGAITVGAAFGAVLWAIHPLRVEAVAWASARIYGQAAFFLFLSFWSYLRYQDQETIGKSQGWLYTLSLISWLCSLLTYPIGLGMVLVLLFLDIHPLGRRSPEALWTRSWWSRVLLEKTPYALAASLVLGLTLWSRFNSGIYQAPVSLEAFGLGERFMQAMYVWAYYVWKPWIPTGLSPVYPTLIEFNMWQPVFWGSVALVVGLSAWLWNKRHRFPGLLAIWASYLVIMVPLLGLTEHPHFASDRYSYVAALGWTLVLAGGLARLISLGNVSRIQWVGGVAGASIILLSWASFRQISIWEDSAGLHIQMIERLGANSHRHKLYLVLGNIYLERQQPEKAALCFQEVIAIDPTQADAHSNLADLLADHGQLGQAEKHYGEAIRLRPNHLTARQNWGVALARSGRFEEAIVQFRTVLQFHPRNVSAHYNLSLALKQLGHDDEARFFEDRGRQLERSNGGGANVL